MLAIQFADVQYPYAQDVVFRNEGQAQRLNLLD